MISQNTIDIWSSNVSPIFWGKIPTRAWEMNCESTRSFCHSALRVMPLHVGLWDILNILHSHIRKRKKVSRYLAPDEHSTKTHAAGCQNTVESEYYYVIEGLSEHQRALSAYSADHKEHTALTANQWALLEKQWLDLNRLQGFKRKVSSHTASTVNVVPSVTVLKRLLSENWGWLRN